MKKFRFSLESVLDYKQQELDARKAEQVAAQAAVLRQEKVLADARERYTGLSREFQEKAQSGLKAAEAMTYEMGLRVLEAEIQQEVGRLEELQRIKEAKRAAVVEARQESASLEKLREKKLESYRKDVQKSEERLIDELVSAARVSGGQNLQAALS